jgi:Tol biopolymer transport system component
MMKRISTGMSISALLIIILILNGEFLTFSAALAQSTGTTKIVFLTYDPDGKGMVLNIANADGSNVIPLLTDGNFYFPVISPDGRYIVFDAEPLRSSRRNLFMINSDGTNLHPLMEMRSSVRPTGPIAWSPDSTQLIFGFLDSNRRPAGFYRMNTDGSGLEQVEIENLPVGSSTTSFADTWVAWSPDGEQIAFKVRTDADTGRMNGVFYVASPDGSGAVPFTGLNDQGAASDRWSWSPDGTRILLYSLEARLFDEGIYVANADGSNLETLIDQAGFPSSFAWCSDDSQIVFIASEAGVDFKPDGDLWVVNTDGSRVRTLSIAGNVADVGVSCGVVPADIGLPAAPISFMADS